MRLIYPSINLEKPIIESDILRNIERAGRTAYKSEDKITPKSAKKFVSSIIKNGHESVLEHGTVSFRIICDRGVSHEIVRHRIASYTQESTRYCKYKDEVNFVIPPWIEIKPGEYAFDDPLHTANIASIIWAKAMWNAEDDYIRLLKGGWTPQQARSVLPNSLKTEIVMTANLREWRHFLKLRTSPKAHPQMQQIANMILNIFKAELPIIVKI